MSHYIWLVKDFVWTFTVYIVFAMVASH